MSNSTEQQERNAAILQSLGGNYHPSAQEQQWQVPQDDTARGRPLAFAREEGNSKIPMAVWVLPDLILALGVALVWQVAVILIYSFMSGNPNQQAVQELINNPSVMLMVAPSMSFGLVTMAALRVHILRGLRWDWFNLSLKDFGRNTGWGLVGGFAFLVVNVLSGLIFRGLGSQSDQAEQMTKPFLEASHLQIALFGLFVVFIGPLCEEIFFRGYVMRAIVQRLGPAWGIGLSALMFSLPHAFGITTGFLGLLVSIFLGGAILGYVYYRTQSLWSAVVAHMLNNGLAFLGLLITILGYGQ